MSVLPPPATPSGANNNGVLTADRLWNTDELDDLLERMPLKPTSAAATSTSPSPNVGASSGSAPIRRSNTTGGVVKTVSSTKIRRKEKEKKLGSFLATEQKKTPVAAEPSGKSSVNLGISLEDLYGFEPPTITKSVTPRNLPVAIQPTRGRARSPLQVPSSSKGNKQSKARSASNSSTGTGSGGRNLTRAVSFDKVKIREFQQILGEHPCIDSGPSLTLGWDYKEKKDVCLFKYESKRNKSTGNLNRLSPIRSRRLKMCALSPQERTDKAVNLGYSMEEIQKNRKQIRRLQKQREETLRNCYDDREK